MGFKHCAEGGAGKEQSFVHHSQIDIYQDHGQVFTGGAYLYFSFCKLSTTSNLHEKEQNVMHVFSSEVTLYRLQLRSIRPYHLVLYRPLVSHSNPTAKCSIFSLIQQWSPCLLVARSKNGFQELKSQFHALY